MSRAITFPSLSPLQRAKWRLHVHALAALRRLRRVAVPAYDIIVTTYALRFDSYFRGTLTQLCLLCPDRRIIVAVNGHHDADVQRRYLSRLEALISRRPNVQCLRFDRPVGLARMWNEAIAASLADRFLILNDDIYLMAQFRSHFERSRILEEPIALINGSWSHFLLSRSVYQAVGAFDDGFEEIGYEDDDYAIRLAMSCIALPSVSLNGVWNCVDDAAGYSYGEAFEVADRKYSAKNQRHLAGKWVLHNAPIDDAVYVPTLAKWAALRRGQVL